MKDEVQLFQVNHEHFSRFILCTSLLDLLKLQQIKAIKTLSGIPLNHPSATLRTLEPEKSSAGYQELPARWKTLRHICWHLFYVFVWLLNVVAVVVILCWLPLSLSLLKWLNLRLKHHRQQNKRKTR